eukprot:scaffold53588_cov30-Tisochrysis_lutea.AAC.4
MYLLGLAYSVHARHGLQVNLRVPVRVKEDAGVGRLAVDTKATRAGRHEENEFGRARHVEAIDVDGALNAVGATVQAAVLILLVVEEVLDQVERRGELREEHHSVALCEQLGQKAAKQLELSRAIHKLVDVVLLARGLHQRSELPPVCPRATGKVAILFLQLLKKTRFAQQEALVPEELHLGERAMDRGLKLRQHALFNLRLGAP